MIGKMGLDSAETTSQTLLLQVIQLDTVVYRKRRDLSEWSEKPHERWKHELVNVFAEYQPSVEMGEPLCGSPYAYTP